ncbi:class I SAM-dependent methyltransferase [Natronoglycomyces albus]|uniref:Class I SAM-dependent methyltransferase n=1 Tax=Natronoglycomyces albus TaxID=2811108 RepID=A0A895XLA1_9ACTN|nr:class I SAM-dependent methyltransferase [Natronoglycomyces albus]QSB04199.1 class I SAM-dependent methyltransferase [Natronoglycomyces albus]
MPDAALERDIAAIYDVLNTWGLDDDFVLDRIKKAQAVLDVGCGTGRVLHGALDAGFTGRLVGIDPDPWALERARVRSEVEWVHGDMSTHTWDREFDLAVMTGNAFQQLVSDEDVTTLLDGVFRALRPGGSFLFGTRDPRAKAWESWSDEPATFTFEGDKVTMSQRVEPPLDKSNIVISIDETMESARWAAPDTRTCQLRFFTLDQVNSLLAKAGFVVAEQYGYWDGRPIDAHSRDIITLAKRP